MKRFLSLALILGLLALPTIGLVGCANEESVEKKETVEGPGGTTTTTSKVEVESTGENPPPNSAGQTAK